MITVAVGDVDCYELFIGDYGLDPFDEVLSLCGGDRCVDEYSFFSAVDESTGYGRPEAAFLAVGLGPGIGGAT